MGVVRCKLQRAAKRAHAARSAALRRTIHAAYRPTSRRCLSTGKARTRRPCVLPGSEPVIALVRFSAAGLGVALIRLGASASAWLDTTRLAGAGLGSRWGCGIL